MFVAISAVVQVCFAVSRLLIGPFQSTFFRNSSPSWNIEENKPPDRASPGTTSDWIVTFGVFVSEK